MDTATGQKSKLLWEKTFGGIYNDEVKTIVPTKDGFIIGAQSNSPIGANKAVDTNGGYDIWLLTLDHNGNLLQQHSYGGTADDFLTDLLPVDNGYLLAGTSSSESSGTKTVSAETQNDFWTVQLDAKMQPTDQKTYDFKGDDVLTSVLLDSDQNLLLSGYTIHPKTHKKSYVSIHINAQGEKIWEKELSTDGDDLLRKAIITRDGGYVFAGNSTGKTSALKKGYQGRNDYWIVKLNTKEKTKTPEIQIEAFPNPTEGFTNVVINHEYEEGQMILSDLSGKVLHTAPLQYDMIAVDLSGYPQGVYIINIKTNVINRSVKVIKK
ncbi:T9SS type A sorting domain-containing protein [Myroides ceti]|uniref:T9SS type A sorting domain-containing protein n=1 Tax=Paenimyroides ceti TaxID=395087 RepID=A0ABT8CY41_9FLAO|nr:T9SS type A sorting domain-containing protein [Paenimyroides ceti]MDN3708651.1 T9SS type A sorting domain-containing protein [Paenimyroides ceti]